MNIIASSIMVVKYPTPPMYIFSSEPFFSLLWSCINRKLAVANLCKLKSWLSTS